MAIVQANANRESHLHSTMFIFILSKVEKITMYGEFTFHYVYIYIKWCYIYFIKSNIYIPLCLYLYDDNTNITLSPLSGFTFHYVYIYIASSASDVRRISVFTFHYVYIYMAVATWNS